MKRLIGFVGLWAAFALHSAFAFSQIEQLPKEVKELSQQPARFYLQQMQQAYRQLNYELLYINTAQHPIEPKQQLHGLYDNSRITYLRYLNGATRESLQVDDKVSYYEQGSYIYSIATPKDQSVFAAITNLDLQAGSQVYQYEVLGKERIASRKTIAIRILNKDRYRYGYIVYLDTESYLPLRLDTVNHYNEVVDQVMVVSLTLTERINPTLVELITQNTPEVLAELQKENQDEVLWKIDWLPNGFDIIKGDRHKLIMHDTDPVSYIMLSDGMVTVSVYISTKATAIEEQQSVIQRAGTLLYTLQQGIIEVTIIGEIPLLTAEKIAASIKALE